MQRRTSPIDAYFSTFVQALHHMHLRQYLWVMRTKESHLTKKGVLRTLKDMPDTFHTEELIERLILLSKVEAGKADAEAGRTLSMDEMREHIRARWSK